VSVNLYLFDRFDRRSCRNSHMPRACCYPCVRVRVRVCVRALVVHERAFRGAVAAVLHPPPPPPPLPPPPSPPSPPSPPPSSPPPLPFLLFP